MSEIITGEMIAGMCTILGMILTASVVFLVKKLVSWVQTKISVEEYNKALKVAVGIWKVLEDEFKDQPGMGEVKKQKMEEQLRKLFPKLTQEELDSINKSVHTAITNGIDGVAEAMGVRDLIK